jgi:hypothetical protein
VHVEAGPASPGLLVLLISCIDSKLITFATPLSHPPKEGKTTTIIPHGPASNRTSDYAELGVASTS